MILSGSRIKEEINNTIIIDPYDESKLNSNSYNLSLASKVLIYENDILDMKKRNPTKEIIMPKEGYRLLPGQLYLGSTIERTYSSKYIPIIEGRSSVARLGLFIHISAGLGEAGFDGHWTLELTCVRPLIIYPGTSICQIYFNEISGQIDLCNSRKYQNSMEAGSSKMYMEIGGLCNAKL